MAEPSTMVYEPWTPVQCERKLSELFTTIAQAEIQMRKQLEHELDCKLAYERAHAIASTHPECPRPSRAAEITVAQRDDWIRGFEIDEYEAYEMARLNTQLQKRYMERLGDQVSIVQTMSKHVLAAYAGPVGAGAR